MMPKEPHAGDPDLHLERKLSRAQLESGAWAWFTSLYNCAQEAVRICRQLLSENLDPTCELMFQTFEEDEGARWS